MSECLSKARKQFCEIEYHYKFSESGGFSQAFGHYHRLSELLTRASRSKLMQADATMIHGLVQDAKNMMDEMKVRESA